MSLQRRLMLFFVVIVMLPLTTAGIMIQASIIDRLTHETGQSRSDALAAASLLYRQRADAADSVIAAGSRSGRLATLLRRDREQALESRLRVIARERPLDFAVLTSGRRVIARWGWAPRFSGGFPRPRWSTIVGSDVGPHAGYYRTEALSVEVRGAKAPPARLTGGFWLDDEFLRALEETPVTTSLVAHRVVIASTGDVQEKTVMKLSPGGSFVTKMRDPVVADAQPARGRRVDQGLALVASTPVSLLTDTRRSSTTVMVQILGLALVAISALAYLLARVMTQPLKELTAGAAAVARGDLEYEVPAHSGDEIGRLGESFNYMTGQLRNTITELSGSRDRLERVIRRTGETLRSTHDMNQLLTSILNMASEALEADAAVLWMPAPTGSELYPAVAEGLDLAELRPVRLGTGLAGTTAQTGAPTLLSHVPEPGAGEPGLPVGVAVPFISRGAAAAVLALYRVSKARPFTDEDQNTMVFLAEQGGVAMENVILHDEARRLSYTDGLTGLGNRRYLQMRFRTELAGAWRFNHPLSLILMDLDYFKPVNDTYGHQRGDETLVELARRVDRELREVDAFVRFGGEEFVCLLPNTDLDGAVVASEKILRLTAANPFGRADQDPIKLTASVGVATFPLHGNSFSALLELADKALYRAKQDGRDRVRVARLPGTELELAT